MTTKQQHAPHRHTDAYSIETLTHHTRCLCQCRCNAHSLCRCFFFCFCWENTHLRITHKIQYGFVSFSKYCYFVSHMPLLCFHFGGVLFIFLLHKAFSQRFFVSTCELFKCFISNSLTVSKKNAFFRLFWPLSAIKFILITH